jgi:gliding motility-associated-like protein
LPDGITTYTYTTQTPVEDGFYGIRKQVTGHKGTWHQATDHTGNGYMMLVNASYDAGLFYETKVEGLCQGSSFYFSAWIANLMIAGASGPLDPDIRFVILRASDSSVIGEYTTGPLSRYSKLTWENYGIHFKLPAGESSVILQIFNNQTGGNGNDLVLDDITFSLCGPAIGINQTGVYQDTHDACTGDKVSLQATISAGFYKEPQYQWQYSQDTVNWQDIPDAATTSYSISAARRADSGWYRILVAENGNIHSPHCRIASSPVPLRVWSPEPFVIAATRNPVCEGDALQLTAPEALAYQWQEPGGITSDKPEFISDHIAVAQQGTYLLTRVTRGGCTSKAQINIIVQPNDLRVSLGNDSILCEGNVINLDATNADAAYQWNTGQQSSGITVDTAGFYKVIVSKGTCQKSDSISIREILKPAVDLGEDTTICTGESYTLDATFADADNYRWQDGSAQPVYRVSQPGIYSVIVTNRCGTAMSTLQVKTEACADHLIFPTAFSPNGDGQNDFFRPRVFLHINQYEMKIFDRWGRLVFHSFNPDNGWDGRYSGISLPVGAYIWTVHYTRERDHQPVAQRGSVTLIR